MLLKLGLTDFGSGSLALAAPSDSMRQESIESSNASLCVGLTSAAYCAKSCFSSSGSLTSALALWLWLHLAASSDLQCAAGGYQRNAYPRSAGRGLAASRWSLKMRNRDEIALNRQLH